MIIQDVGNDTLYIRYRNGRELVTENVKCKPYYWTYKITDKESLVNYDGKKVYKQEYRNSKRRSYIKNEELTFEVDVSLENRYLIDNYKTLPDYEPRIIHLDIETAMSLDTVFVPEPITAITIYDSYTKKYITFTWKDSGYSQDLAKKLSNENWEVIISVSEETMLKTFLSYFVEIDPDIITGWNVLNYDIPYVINRMYHLGIDPSVLSPVQKVEV